MPLPALYSALYLHYLPRVPDGASGATSGSLTRQGVACPFHADRNPSASVYFDTGVFICPICGTFSASGFISKITGCSYKEADIIVSEFLSSNDDYKRDDSYFSKSPKRNPRWDELVKESQKNLSPDLPIVKEYLQRKGLQYETLIKAGIGFLPACKTHWNQDSLVFPYIIQSHVWGIRYRNFQGDKGGEPGTTFALWGLQDVPEICNSIIIVEGETDRLTAMEMFPTIPVVSTPTCRFKREWKREFNDITSIICIPQSDAASDGLTKSLKDAFNEDIIITDLPWRRGQFGKDLNDWRDQNDSSILITSVNALAINGTELMISGDDLDLMDEDKEFLIEGILSPGQFVAIVGPQKAKKSWMMLNLIRSLISDAPFLGLPGAVSYGKAGNILIVEEEGTKKDLSDRAKLVLAGTDWRNQTIWMHKKGVQLDSSRWIEKLSKIIDEKKVGVLFLDCLYKMHSKNEDKAQEMSPIWANIRLLQRRYPRLVVVLIHHFGKAGEVIKGWNSIRGSSSLGAEVDLAIFQEKKDTKTEEIINVKFDGREVRDITDTDGNEVLKCTHYNNGIIELAYDKKVVAQRAESFYDELEERKTWGLLEAAEHMGVSRQTIRSWIDKADGKYMVTSPARGNPAKIVIL